MIRRGLVIALAAILFYAPALWAQHGAWEGCTLKNMKARYTDQQVGGLLLHESATLVKEASQAVIRARTPEERRALSSLLSAASLEMEHISNAMKNNKLSQKKAQRFQQEMVRIRKEIRRISR